MLDISGKNLRIWHGLPDLICMLLDQTSSDILNVWNFPAKTQFTNETKRLISVSYDINFDQISWVSVENSAFRNLFTGIVHSYSSPFFGTIANAKSFLPSVYHATSSVADLHCKILVLGPIFFISMQFSVKFWSSVQFSLFPCSFRENLAE